MTRAESDLVQLKLRFSEGLRSRLDETASRNEASLNSEIVRRLEGSLALEEANGGPATASLVQAIIADIATIEAETGRSWAHDNVTYSAVRRAVLAAILDRPPSRVENHEKVMEALEEAKAKQDEARIALKFVNEGLGPSPEAMSAVAEIAHRVKAIEGEAEQATERADLAYQPQLEAERRGRRLYSSLRARRQESLQARRAR